MGVDRVPVSAYPRRDDPAEPARGGAHSALPVRSGRVDASGSSAARGRTIESSAPLAAGIRRFARDPAVSRRARARTALARHARCGAGILCRASRGRWSRRRMVTVTNLAGVRADRDPMDSLRRRSDRGRRPRTRCTGAAPAGGSCARETAARGEGGQTRAVARAIAGGFFRSPRAGRRARCTGGAGNRSERCRGRAAGHCSARRTRRERRRAHRAEASVRAETAVSRACEPDEHRGKRAGARSGRSRWRRRVGGDREIVGLFCAR